MTSHKPPAKRSVENVLKTLEQAKIKPESLTPCTQVLQFAEKNSKFKCLELSKELLEAVENGETLVIRGKKSDSAVLCTESMTFDLKESETSNSLLILPELVFPDDAEITNTTERTVKIREVSQLIHTYLEPRACKPHFRTLLQLLARQPYKGPECEEDVELVTTEQLLNEVQASEVELRNELDRLFAIQINGSWRLLDFHYQFRVLSMILRYIDQMSMPLKQLKKRETCQELQDVVPKEILEQVFTWYTQPSEHGEDLYQLNEDRVCRTLAEAVLRPAHKFPLSEFQSIWQESVPEGLQTNLNQLCGIAVIERNVSPPSIWYFPEQDLPDNLHERLHRLFQQRVAWPLDEIIPYMERLATPDMPVKALLAKYSRMSTKDGVRYVTGRHAK